MPSEAQWEYACRAKQPTPFTFADGQDGAICGPKLLGYVWEWCKDWYAANFYDSPDHSVPDPENKEAASARVLRSGGHRSTFRDRGEPSSRDRRIEFRLAAVPGAKRGSK